MISPETARFARERGEWTAMAIKLRSQTERSKIAKIAKTYPSPPVKNAIKSVLRAPGILPPDQTPHFLKKRQ